MSDNLTKENNLTSGNPLGCEPIGKLLVKFALPAVTSMVVNAIYNLVDQIFIGKGIGYLGNAATTIAFPIVTVILALATLVGAGGSAYASIKLGEHDREQAEKVLGNALTLSIIIGLLVTTVGLSFFEPLLRLFGATDNTIPYAKDYAFPILLAATFNVLGITLSNFARCDGSPMFSMYSMLAGAVLNIILDPIFMFVFGLGVRGAAIATAISQVVSASILIWYFIYKSNMRFARRSLKINFSICKNFMILGISSCVMHIASTLLNVVLNNILVYYGDQSEVGGDLALSAIGVVMKISMLLMSICIGIGVGGQPILGFNRGAKRPDRVRRAYILATILSFSVSSLAWILCQTIPHILIKLFDNNNQNFVDFAVRCMRIYLGGIFVAGAQIVMTHYFQSTGQPLKANITSLLRQIILLIPLLIILPTFFGLDGVLYAGLYADLTTGVITATLLTIEIKKLNRQIKEME